jgi:hypothetical protein
VHRAAHALRATCRALRLAVAVLTLAVIAAPAAFGPAVGVMMRELGAATEQHVCKCGMPVGKCGCPECERLEQERRREHVPEHLATLKRHCDDDAPAIPFGVLPTGVLSAASSATLPVPRSARVVVVVTPYRLSSRDDQPPTPPPRSASV